MAKELKEKDEARKRSEGPGHVFHNASCEMVTGQGPYNIYVTPSAHTPQLPSYMHGYGQHPYVWQQQNLPNLSAFRSAPKAFSSSKLAGPTRTATLKPAAASKPRCRARASDHEHYLTISRSHIHNYRRFEPRTREQKSEKKL
jgi:hypothetical protein